MAVKRANSLTKEQLKNFIDGLSTLSKRPKIDRAAFLLSYMAGLRVQEIAGLQWDKNILDAKGNFRFQEMMVMGANKRVKSQSFPVLFVSSDIGKYGSERTIVMHPELKKALEDIKYTRDESIHVIPSGKNGAEQALSNRAQALKMYMNRMYAKAGYVNCSSHSGRRTFITNAARKAGITNCSIEDVRALAGHRSIKTTQKYIETTSQQADLVSILYT